MGLQGEGGFKRGLKGASEGFPWLEKGLKGLQGEPVALWLKPLAQVFGSSYQ